MKQVFFSILQLTCNIIDPEITLKNFEFILNSIEKVKPAFFIFLNAYVSCIEQDKILISQLSPPKLRYFAEQNDPKYRPHENEFENFQMQK